MKSLKERLAEKAKREERTRLKRSVGRIPYLSVKVPRIENNVQGDEIYIKTRVADIIKQIRFCSSFDVFNEFRKQLLKIDKQIKAEEKATTKRLARLQYWDESWDEYVRRSRLQQFRQ